MLRLLLLVVPTPPVVLVVVVVGGVSIIDDDGLVDGAPAPRVVPRGVAAAEGGGVRGERWAGVERSRRGYCQVADVLLRVVGGGIGDFVVVVVSSRAKGKAANMTEQRPIIRAGS